ncbi:hypothetical protein NUU61_008977 [Penicillium alfredii]|uniref:Galactose oxidase/kelch, beta-propeller n=1 Tax=Penicillium alfredii TaxID=1506179 RepID=A0A9W9EM49_9EURO|nr:uncharacterized protein NUU61_008977 [Penicillium alfredii]KAJ5084398.1 hypothetical protein NUU61_008977 [Penicillium alfredii]
MDPRPRPKRSRFVLSALLLALLDVAVAIPYTPSSVFLSPKHNDSLAYLFQPSTSAAGKTQFLSLNLSTNINTDSPSYRTLLETTPFQRSDKSSAFIPVIDDHGTVTVYTGDCQSSSENPALWRFNPDNSSATGNGTWEQLPVNPGEGATKPNYLAAGFAFASSNTSDGSMYAFGGMCPFHNTTDQNWISSANYSQAMVVLSPTSSHSTKYNAATTGHRTPPVAEAGMAIVPLPAAYSMASTGKRQDFLFIGGHTQQAFLNMSQLAVFSLPQESWSFVKVNSDTKPKTELVVRDKAAIEPRSGHTAVLSEDGKKVFVLGGWVGDTGIPADPQFAVLELGEEYGGTGEWTWTIPSSQRPGIAKGAGIFGHAAAMLPGGVMMIAGGYSIPKPSSKRATSAAQPNAQVFLYNVTSNNWVSSYSHPSAHSTAPSPASAGSALSSSQKAGLGVGLGLGVPAAIAISLLAWNYYRKRGVRRNRDSQLRELALGAERAHFWGRDDPFQASSIRSSQMSERPDSAKAYPWSENRGHAARPAWKDQGDGSAENTGLLMDAPSPSRNSRPFMNSRSHRLSGYTEYRRSDPVSDIHPIDEREEDEAIFRERLMATIPSGDKPQPSEQSDPFSDTPFATPRSTIFGVGLGPFYTRRKDIGPAEADGRASPAKSDRTSTNLSESSIFSAKTTSQVSQARAILVDRPLSWASSDRHSLEQLAVASTHSKETAHSDLDGFHSLSEKSLSADSYSTAQTTVAQHQAENQSLLFDPIDAIIPPESSPSKLPPASKPKASDWMMQTMRRALTLTRRGAAGQPDANTVRLASGIDRRSTVIGSGPQSNSAGSNIPRRTVSASAELFRRKQGAKDWNASKRMSDGVFGTPRSTRDDLFLGAPGYLGDEQEIDDEDWDIEGAAEGRRVQTTYTVPREKLRVVNATARDMDNISERSISRSNNDLMGTRRVSS